MKKNSIIKADYDSAKLLVLMNSRRRKLIKMSDGVAFLFTVRLLDAFILFLYIQDMSNMCNTLINRGTSFCDFVTETNGELGLCMIIKMYSSLPFWRENVNSWVAKLSTENPRAHVNRILEIMWRKNAKRGFITLMHSHPLAVTHWMKSEQENVTWKDINLYGNKFNEVISKLSFDGNNVRGKNP